MKDFLFAFQLKNVYKLLPSFLINEKNFQFFLIEEKNPTSSSKS